MTIENQHIHDLCYLESTVSVRKPLTRYEISKLLGGKLSMDTVYRKCYTLKTTGYIVVADKTKQGDSRFIVTEKGRSFVSEMEKALAILNKYSDLFMSRGL